MKPTEELARTTTPDGRQLVLSRHSGDYYIDIDGHGLMSTRVTGSERALAELASRELSGSRHPRMLIGGLGLGFTLGAALDTLPRGARVVVAEIFPEVVDWNRRFRFESPKDRLADPRVVVETRDVVDVIREASQPFDAILLDVDNGADACCLKSNRRLYDPAGLARIDRALKPGGVAWFWSTEPSPAFERRLVTAGFRAESTVVRSRGHKGARHAILRAAKPRA
jgi:spermidine synthase